MNLYNRNIMSNFICLSRSVISIRALMGVVFMFCCISAPAFAQYYPGSRANLHVSRVVPSPEEDKSIKKIKDKIEGLLSKNKELEAKYSSLEAEYNSLKKKVSDEQEEVSLLSQYINKVKAEREEKSTLLPSLKTEVQRLQDDMLLRKSGNMRLRAQLLDTEENLRLWELKIADLKLYKKERQMDLELKEYRFNEAKKKQMAEVEELRARLERLLKEEEDCLRAVKDISKRGSSAAEKVSELRRENEQMREKIRKLRHDKEIKLKENSILKDKKLLVIRSGEDALSRKERLRSQYDEIVSQMEEEYNYLSKLMEKLVARQKKRTELMKEIIRIDKENQELRKKIEQLKQKK